MLDIIYKEIVGIKGFIVRVKARNVRLGEIALIKCNNGSTKVASVISVDGDYADMQVFSSSNGISTDSSVAFTGEMFSVKFSKDMLGRIFNGLGESSDGGESVLGEKITTNLVSYNPESRKVPSQMIRTGVPAIDIFNCLVTSQKIPVFCSSGDNYNELLLRIVENTSADIVIIGGISMSFDEYRMYQEFMESAGRSSRTISFMHKAEEPIAEAINIPDMVLKTASRFAIEGKSVLVVLSDMTAFSDALKEVAITMDQLPSNRGYPGTLYSDLAKRYEQAVSIPGSGSVTIISATTMPGGDMTHPVPDNTGYITEGQICLSGNMIDPFKSLSRLKQLVIGKSTKKDHAEIANAMIRFYDEAKRAVDKQLMGFELNKRDEGLISFSKAFEEEILSLSVVMELDDALDLCWNILGRFFSRHETGIKQSILEEFWKGKR